MRRRGAPNIWGCTPGTAPRCRAPPLLACRAHRAARFGVQFAPTLCEALDGRDGPQCEAAAAEGPCLASAEAAVEGALPADALSEDQIAACTTAAGGRFDDSVTAKAATCIAHALGLNAGIRPWVVERVGASGVPGRPDGEPGDIWQVDALLSSERDCCRFGCQLQLDVRSGRPLRVSEYGSCP
ncbi:hypothetical protein L6V77_11220 [Myxococcota bacterium]|nr:hypothetical protein [Myxococcota bacterium]